MEIRRMRTVVSIGIVALLSACTASSTSSGTGSSETPSASNTPLGVLTLPANAPSPKAKTVLGSACRKGSPLANVYHPDRLLVIASCKTVSGVIESITREPDGDVHFDLKLDPPYAKLINGGNVSGQHGWLVAEIVPADEPGCALGKPPKPVSGTYNYGYCTGADITSPPIGTHVSATGPYVLDQSHGWMEIHPVWRIVHLASTVTRIVSATGVRIVSVTSPAQRGSNATLIAQTSARATCSLSVTLPSSAQSQSAGLGAGNADSSGRVQWTWKIGTRTTPGTATATVSCGSHTVSKTFTIE